MALSARQRAVAPSDAPDSTPEPRGGAQKPLSALYASMSEREFQAIVREALQDRGWLVFVVPDMRRTAAGLPDLLALHVRHDVLLAWELKTEKGRIRPEQRSVLALLDNVAGVDARIVRPRDWQGLRDALDSRSPSLALACLRLGW